MIIGNGDISDALKQVDRKDLLFFASGVSNSKETRESEYKREKYLLRYQDRTKHLVYFSSLSIFYSNSRYSQHKIDMEGYVKAWFEHYTILRLGNITWGDNPHTLINYFKNCIKENKPFKVENTYRYIVDKDEFLYWIKLIPDWNCEMNIVGKRLKVQEIIDRYCYACGYQKL